MPTNAWGRDHTRPGILSCLFVIASLLVPGILHAQTILLGEINWAGSDASTADEWIELWNIGTEPQSLHGWRLAGASKEPITFSESQTIPPQQTFLVANYNENEKRSTLSVQPDFVTTEVSLANDTLHLTLLNAEGTITDEAGNGGKPPAGSTHPLSSMVRQDTTIEGEKAEAWSTSTSTLNLDANTVGHGTPGICDACRPVSTSSTSIPTNSTSTYTDPVFYPSASSTISENTSSTNSFSSSTSWPTSFTSSTFTGTTSTETEWIWSTSSTYTTTTLLLTTAPTSTYQETTSTVAKATPTTPTVAANNILLDNAPLAPACTWHLNSIFPAPSDGPEWVELTGCLPERKNLQGWSINDPTGHILTFTNETVISAVESEVVRVPLPGQHLRNTGDTVILRGPDGSIYDIVAYPSLKHDEHYQRRGDGTWRIPERTATETTNTTPPTAIPTPSPSPTPIPSPTTNTPVAPPLGKPSKPISIASPKTAAPIFSLSYEEYKTPTSIPAKKPAPKPSKTSSPRKGSKKSSASMSKNQSPRVRVEGIVGTPAGLIGKQRFVLLNSEGKGLLIHANNKQPSPPLHTSIEISGSIVTNNDGVYLKMYNDDRWHQKTNNIPPPEPQTVDFETRNPEKNWNLVELVGTVNASSRASAKMVVDDLDIDVAIPSSLNYRAERLKKGDTVRIRGVIDTNRETPRLYPRQAAEITLVKHASISTTSPQTTNDTVPPWLPIGAASTTIAGGYGWKRLQKWREQKHLEEQLEDAVKQLSESS